MYFTTAVATAIGLLGANVAAQGLGQTAICPFDGNRGPNILFAVVELPDGGTEVDAWLYGYNWCSHSNFVSDTGDICSDTGTDRTVEFMHAPFTNKFGAFDPICYANIDIQLFGCEPAEDGQGYDYSNVVAWVTSKPPDRFSNSAVDAAPNFGPQRGQFGQPPQGEIPVSEAGPGAINNQQSSGGQPGQFSPQQFGSNQAGADQFGGNQGNQFSGGNQNGGRQFNKRQQSQSQGGLGQSQNQNFQPSSFGSSNNGVPQSLQGGNFDPSQQGGSFNPQQQGSFSPQQQGSFSPQQQGSFNPQSQQGSFAPQQQGGFQPQQQGSFSPTQQQQQQQQQQQGNNFRPGQIGPQPGGFGGQPGYGGGQSPNWGGGQQSSYLYQCFDDRELRACVYNSQTNPQTETKLSAFMSCGVMGEP